MPRQRTPPGDGPASPQARRPKGSGSVYQRKDGTWIAAVEWPSEGKRVRKLRERRTEREARAALKDLLHERERDTPPLDTQRTLSTFLDEWFTTTAPRLAEETRRHWDRTIHRHITPEIGRVPLAALTPPQVQRWLTRLEAAGIGPWARIQAHMILRAALNDALRWRQVALNAAALVKAPSAPRRTPTILTPEHARDLLAAVAGSPWEPILHLALYGALRQGEILALRWRDVDLQAGIVTISATLTRGKGRHRKAPKTARSHRLVPLSAATIAVLRAHRQREEQARRFPALDAFLFIEPSNGQPLAASKVAHGWKRLLAQSGVPPMPFHDLRHCALSYMHAAGIPIGTVQAIAGHASAATTLGVYINPQVSEQRAAVEAVARLLAAPESTKQVKENS